MAQPRRKGGAEPEEITRLQAQAVDAANAFRDYIVGGDPARRQFFWTTYNQAFGGATLHDNSTFMTKLFEELDRIGRDPGVQPLLAAFTADRGSLFGFLWSNPVHFTDFIDTTYNIRQRLEGGTARPADITRLSRQVRESQGRPARADTQVGRVRAAMEANTSLTVEDAVRAELERPSREEATARYGDNLTREVIARSPGQLAIRAAVALRDFILTGDESKRTLFRSIWDANTTQAFTDAFTAEFTARIYRDSGSGLAAIAQAYNTRHSGTDPIAFATMITQLYAAAGSRTDTTREIEQMRTAEGTNVVDPLLAIVARGMAGRAITLMRDVLENGTPASRDQFVAILNGRLAVIANNAVQMPNVENNDVFWNEFTRLYTAEIGQSSRLATLVRSFQRNILPIAIRDIYTELARASPDTARLNADYGPDLVGLIASNTGTLSWMARPDSDLSSEITRRSRAEDPAAVRVSGVRLAQGVSRPAALRETYIALVQERAVTRTVEAPDVTAILERNFDSLSYLAGTPAQVQREIERRARARPPDAVAQQLLARFPTNAGASLSAAYTALRDARTRRAALVTQYGQEFVDIVAANLDGLQWVMRPVEEIDSQMRSRRDDAFVRSVNTRIGYSVGTLAHGLRDIYTEFGRPTPDRARLDQTYGSELVTLVATNRASLGWLGSDLATVERTLQDPSTDATTRSLQLKLYSYTPVQLVSAIARARSAITRRGLALADATDAYGTVFVGPVVSRQAVVTPSISPEVAQPLQQVLESRALGIVRQFEEIDRQLRWPILEPARVLIQERIRLWRQENDAIRLEARQTQDPTALAALETRQATLINSMLTPAEMRRSVEMAFAMVHLAETGGDMSRAPSLSDVTTTDQDIGTLRRLSEWYRGLSTTGKQPVVGEVVSSVLYRADPNLYQFITGLSEPGFVSAISRVYSLTRRIGGDNRQTLVALYGEQFVALVESQAPHLRILESPSVMANPAATMASLRRGENELYASIVVRVYRAVSSPAAGEDRARMESLFGPEFVAAVVANQAQMTALGTGTAGLPEVQALPESVRRALAAAYPAAYQRSIGALVRGFRNQEDWMFRSMSAVYAALRERPARGASADATQAYAQRVRELNAAYGDSFVATISENMAQFEFLQRPTSSPRDLANIPPELRERLNTTFEGGPAVGRASFMTNFLRVYEQLPRVYTQLRGALAFSNPTDTLPTTLANAIAYYRQQFGSNNYLFNQYINLDLLSRNIQRIARRYNVQLPPNIADGIDSPEELSQFISTETGRSLLAAGRTFYNDTLLPLYQQQKVGQQLPPDDRRLHRRERDEPGEPAFHPRRALPRRGARKRFGNRQRVPAVGRDGDHERDSRHLEPRPVPRRAVPPPGAPGYPVMLAGRADHRRRDRGVQRDIHPEVRDGNEGNRIQQRPQPQVFPRGVPAHRRQAPRGHELLRPQQARGRAAPHPGAQDRRGIHEPAALPLQAGLLAGRRPRGASDDVRPAGLADTPASEAHDADKPVPAGSGRIHD